MVRIQSRRVRCVLIVMVLVDFEYSEDSVVVSGKLVTRCVISNVIAGCKANMFDCYVSAEDQVSQPISTYKTDELIQKFTRNGISLCIHSRRALVWHGYTPRSPWPDGVPSLDPILS